MAQAPQGGGGGGAPRQNKTIKQFAGMNTQNKRNALPEGTFAWLENIQPIGAANLHSIPGRGESVTRIPPIIPPVLCTDATARGQQNVTIEDRFDQFNSFPPNTNLRTSWGYIDAAEEVFTLIGEAGCAGGNMAYESTCCQLNHFQTPSSLTHPALIDPHPLDPAINTVLGTSDEPIYGYRLTDFTMYYPNSNTRVQYHLPADGRGLTATTGENFFGKRDATIYFPCHSTVFPFDHYIVGFSAGGGVVVFDFDPLPQAVVAQFALTANFLYVLSSDIGDPTLQSISKISRTSGALVDQFFIDNIGPQSIGVVNDNLIYVFTFGTPAALYYLINFTDLIYIGNTTGQGITNFGPTTGMFVNGAFYYGSSGFAGFSTDIFKVTIACPEGSPATPLVASVNRGSASVAAGASINASWADVLEPDPTDTIMLFAEPAAGHLGFLLPALASQVTDGTGTGTISFTIPGGTPPGTYVFMYAAQNVIYVATSPTFTVT